MQPDELLAWIEFYEQARRSTSGPRSRPTAGAAPGATRGRATAPISASLSAEAAAAFTPDLSGASGPLDPWGAGRQGETVAPQPTVPTPATPFVARTPSLSRLADFNVPANSGFTRATGGARASDQANTFDHADTPTARTPAANQADQSDAWLRETDERPSVSHESREEPALHDDYPSDPWAAQPAPERPYISQEDSAWPAPDLRPPHTTAAPQPYTAAAYEQSASAVDNTGQRWADAWRDGPSAPPQTHTPDDDEALGEDPDQYEEDLPTAEMEAAPTPWRDEGWQPPILPRFGPQSAQRDSEPEQR
jgi:hypothetical protein